MAGSRIHSRSAEGNERMNAFSDGVFAIAITLLVLELKVPEHLPKGGFLELLPELLPKLAGHVVAFIVLGVYWVGHHNMFMHIHRHDRVLLWLNVFYLMFVAAMPFFAGLMISHREDTGALVFYAANLAMVGFVQDAMWWHATRGRRLVDSAMADDLVVFVHRRILLAPVVYLASIGVALFNPTVAIVMVVLVALSYIFPNPLDKYHHRQLSASSEPTT